MSSENKPVMPPERIEETETEEEIRQEEAAKGKGERAFEVFCAAIFLGMIGLVFFNAFLRYVFRSSFAPSEEWARFLFIYITFIGGIEAFYRHKHIAVDMFVNMISGTSRKAVDIVASLFMLAALVLLLFGGISVVLQTLDTYSVATDVNMAFINGTLPVMAFAAIIIHLRDIVQLIRTPASEFNTAPKTEEGREHGTYRFSGQPVRLPCVGHSDRHCACSVLYGFDVLRRHVGQHVRHDHPAVHAGRREQLPADGHSFLRVRR